MVLAADNTCTGAIIRDTREFNIYTRELLFRVKREICINIFFRRYTIGSTLDIYTSRVFSFLDIIFLNQRERFIYGEDKFVDYND